MGSACSGPFLQCVSDGQAVLIQTAVLVVGGIWGVFLYRRRRESQATILITPEWRLAVSGGQRLLIVSIRFENASRVAIRGVEAGLAVYVVNGFDASNRPEYLAWRVIPNLLVEVEGTHSVEGPSVLFRPSPPTIWEPGECVVTEAGLPEPPSQLLGMLVDAYAPRAYVMSFLFRLLHVRSYGLRLWKSDYWKRLWWSWSAFRLIALEPPLPPPAPSPRPAESGAGWIGADPGAPG